MQKEKVISKGACDESKVTHMETLKIHCLWGDYSCFLFLEYSVFYMNICFLKTYLWNVFFLIFSLIPFDCLWILSQIHFNFRKMVLCHLTFFSRIFPP